ncbi:phage baseplate assembly protein gpV [Paenibacillus jamilae]|nr:MULTISPECIES: hypothetical protein [Paenibacillus]MDP9676044.1 phage baseplate assembly protein gpV [Paenibacillus jamilae]MEB4781055.1 hypothetical protein [Paenibacillus jamilae]MEE4561973.1 hypothetical protein [Paenibacillus polymyxa]MEE4566170.1 hypothetical protein [Paenibacillus polymyxa]
MPKQGMLQCMSTRLRRLRAWKWKKAWLNSHSMRAQDTQGWHATG